MSGGSFVGGGMLAILVGVGFLGFGFWETRVNAIYMGASMVLVGYIMTEIGRRVPY